MAETSSPIGLGLVFSPPHDPTTSATTLLPPHDIIGRYQKPSDAQVPEEVSTPPPSSTSLTPSVSTFSLDTYPTLFTPPHHQVRFDFDPNDPDWNGHHWPRRASAPAKLGDDPDHPDDEGWTRAREDVIFRTPQTHLPPSCHPYHGLYRDEHQPFGLDSFQNAFDVPAWSTSFEPASDVGQAFSTATYHHQQAVGGAPTPSMEGHCRPSDVLGQPEQHDLPWPSTPCPPPAHHDLVAPPLASATGCSTDVTPMFGTYQQSSYPSTIAQPSQTGSIPPSAMPGGQYMDHSYSSQSFFAPHDPFAVSTGFVDPRHRPKRPSITPLPSSPSSSPLMSSYRSIIASSPTFRAAGGRMGGRTKSLGPSTSTTIEASKGRRRSLTQGPAAASVSLRRSKTTASSTDALDGSELSTEAAGKRRSKKTYDPVADPSRKHPCHEVGCGQSYRRHEALKRHIRTVHAKDRPYACVWPGCCKPFSRHDNLTVHFETHRRKDWWPLIGRPVEARADQVPRPEGGYGDGFPLDGICVDASGVLRWTDSAATGSTVGRSSKLACKRDELWAGLVGVILEEDFLANGQ